MKPTWVLAWALRTGKGLCRAAGGHSLSRAVYGARELRNRLTWAPVSSFPRCSPHCCQKWQWLARAVRDSRTTVEPMENDAPCVMGTQHLPVATTGRAGEPAAAHRFLVARTAVTLPKFSGATQLEPYLAQLRLAEWHNGWGAEEAVVHLALALEGMAARVLLDLDQADQRDLQALIRALERRFGDRVFRDQSRQLLSSHCRREQESLGVYAADVQLLTRRGYPEFSAAVCGGTCDVWPAGGVWAGWERTGLAGGGWT
ncbi:unnamed protein product [Boreogadus saida]